LNKTKPVKVLIIRFSSIGDIVLTTPVLRCLDEQSDVEIHFLTKKVYAPLLEHNPHVTKLHLLENSLSEKIAELKEYNFDYIVDLHRNIRSKKLVQALKCKTYSVDKKSLDRWLLVHMKLDRLQGNHIVDRYMKTVHPLNIYPDKKGLDIFFPKQDTLQSKLPSKYVAIVIGTKHKTKDLPIALVKDIIQELHMDVVLIGGKEHIETAHLISEGTSCTNVVGSTSILESVAILNSALCVISPDTGMMHIAAALKKPLVAVYGSTASSLGFTPYIPEKKELYAIVEENTLSCRPCTKMGRNSCPKKHFNCMNNLDYRTIVEKARALID